MSEHEVRVIQQTAVLAGILSAWMQPQTASMYAVELANHGLLEETTGALVHAMVNTTNMSGVEIIGAIRAYRACMQSLGMFAFMGEEPISIVDRLHPSLN